MKKAVLLLAIIVIGLQVSMAQTREITEKATCVADEKAIPGVFVPLKGTTLGTITDNCICNKFVSFTPAKTLNVKHIKYFFFILTHDRNNIYLCNG